MSTRSAARKVLERIEERIDAGRLDHQIAVVQHVAPLKVELMGTGLVLEAGADLTLSTHVRDFAIDPGLASGDNLLVQRLSGHWVATGVLSDAVA